MKKKKRFEELIKGVGKLLDKIVREFRQHLPKVGRTKR